MKRFALIALAATSTVFAAGKALHVSDDRGNSIQLHEHKGSCIGAAREAAHITARGEREAAHITARGERTPGCWIANEELVQVVFPDGSAYQIPRRAFKPVLDV